MRRQKESKIRTQINQGKVPLIVVRRFGKYGKNDPILRSPDAAARLVEAGRCVEVSEDDYVDKADRFKQPMSGPHRDTRIRFIRRYKKYTPGDVTVRAREQADKLADAGVARILGPVESDDTGDDQDAPDKADTVEAADDTEAADKAPAADDEAKLAELESLPWGGNGSIRTFVTVVENESGDDFEGSNKNEMVEFLFDHWDAYQTVKG